MPKDKFKTVYVCTNCGETSPRWMGRCPSCGAWNTMAEDVVREEKPARASAGGKGAVRGISSGSLITAHTLSEISATEEKSRIITGISELDRVLGGGIVLGSVVLLGGEPGAGKSTLLLQLCGAISKAVSVLYITGEESTRQIKLRALRLEVPQDGIRLAAETEIDDICVLIEQEKPGLVVIDSIQTMHCGDISSSAGSVSQVKECTSRLLAVAKNHEIPTFIVGHVNKDGAIAGPKVMEHIVDTVLYFEGDKMLPYRILRAAKNRYVSGNCVACTLEGSRPILSEIQALVSKTAFGTPRRAASGFDFNRTNLLLAVLEKRAGYFLGNLDVYLNIVGGLQLDETACDLSVCMAVVSSMLDRPVPDDMVAIGEVGLGGEVRSVSNLELRLREARRLGFVRAVVPKYALKQIEAQEFSDMELLGVTYVRQAVQLL